MMDFKSWSTSKKAHTVFLEEEKIHYGGRKRKKKIFVEAEVEEKKVDPRDNIFFKDEEEKKKEHDSGAWLDRDSVEGLMRHSLTMSSGKAGVVKGHKANSSMSNSGDFVFDPFNPQENLTLNGGPIPFSRNHKLKRKKIHEVHKGPLVEESMASWAQEEEEKDKDIDFGAYGDGVERPKKVKELSDKRKRALLLKGNPNPASQMRQQLQYKAAMDQYKKNKGIETEDTVDHNKIAQYGAVEVRRKKGDDDDVTPMDEDAVKKLQEEIEAKRQEELRAIAEKELAAKERQLVMRRLGDLELEARRGTLQKIGGLVNQSFRHLQGKYDEPTKIMPFLWLGNSQTAHNKKLLVDMGVTHVLNTAIDVDNAFPDLFVYCKIALYDSSDQEMDGVFEHAFKFINRVKECGGRLLVHCTAGVSRAATVVLGYVIQEEERLLIDAYNYIRHLRPVIAPNENFLYHLALLEARVHNVTSVAFSKTWRFYKYTQLKSGNDPELDSDGPIRRKQGVGLFVMTVFAKLGTKKKKAFITKLLEDMYGAFFSAKYSHAIAQQRASQRMKSSTNRRSTQQAK